MLDDVGVPPVVVVGIASAATCAACAALAMAERRAAGSGLGGAEEAGEAAADVGVPASSDESGKSGRSGNSTRRGGDARTGRAGLTGPGKDTLRRAGAAGDGWVEGWRAAAKAARSPCSSAYNCRSDGDESGEAGEAAVVAAAWAARDRSGDQIKAGPADGVAAAAGGAGELRVGSVNCVCIMAFKRVNHVASVSAASASKTCAWGCCRRRRGDCCVAP